MQMIQSDWPTIANYHACMHCTVAAAIPRTSHNDNVFSFLRYFDEYLETLHKFIPKKTEKGKLPDVHEY